jgi:cysteinyl-tRNA synthetase
MNRIQFIIVTTLSGIVALCIFLQIIFVRLSAADEMRLRQYGEALQEGQSDFDHLQQIATRVAQLAQQQNDDQLRDLLTRQNIQIKDTNNGPAAAAAPSTPAPTTTSPSTH